MSSGFEDGPPRGLEELGPGPPPEELNEQDCAMDDELNEGVPAVGLFASRELGGLSDMWILSRREMQLVYQQISCPPAAPIDVPV